MSLLLSYLRKYDSRLGNDAVQRSRERLSVQTAEWCSLIRPRRKARLKLSRVDVKHDGSRNYGERGRGDVRDERASGDLLDGIEREIDRRHGGIESRRSRRSRRCRRVG